MKEEYLFRGKSYANEWEYGSLVYNDKDCYIAISISHWIWVSTKTVSQYTGMKDKNNNRIFEGDIVIVNDYLLGSDYDGRRFIVKFIEFGYVLIPEDDERNAISFFNECAEYEVVGNIFE